MLYFWQISNFQPQQKRRSIQTNTADIHVVNEIPSIVYKLELVDRMKYLRSIKKS